MENKFKIVLAVPEYIKDSINVMAKLAVETTFEVTTESLSTAVMDPANVAMIIYKLHNAACVEYTITEQFKFKLNLNQLNDILKKAKKEDILIIQDSGNNIEVIMRASYDRKYKIPMIEIEEKETKAPVLDFKETLILDSKVFKDVIKNHEEISDSVKFIGGGEEFITESVNDLNQELKIPLKDIKIEKSENSTCKYSAEYLIKMVEGAKCADEVVIEFGKDWPLRLSYINYDKYELRFFLAPKVENEE